MEASPPAPPSAANLKVLVVDNKEASRQFVSKLLSECNYQVASCATSREALALLAHAQSDPASQSFGLVLKDHNPPSTNACRFLRKLANAPFRPPPVVVMSGQDERDIVVECLTLGAIDYLVKPLRHNELRHIWIRAWWWQKQHSFGGGERHELLHMKKRRNWHASSYEGSPDSESGTMREEAQEDPTSREGSAPDMAAAGNGSNDGGAIGSNALADGRGSNGSNDGANGNSNNMGASKEGNGTSRVGAVQDPVNIGNSATHHAPVGGFTNHHHGSGGRLDQNGGGGALLRSNGSKGHGASTTLHDGASNALGHTAEGRLPMAPDAFAAGAALPALPSRADVAPASAFSVVPSAAAASLAALVHKDASRTLLDQSSAAGSAVGDGLRTSVSAFVPQTGPVAATAAAAAGTAGAATASGAVDLPTIAASGAVDLPTTAAAAARGGQEQANVHAAPAQERQGLANGGHNGSGTTPSGTLPTASDDTFLAAQRNSSGSGRQPGSAAQPSRLQQHHHHHQQHQHHPNLLPPPPPPPHSSAPFSSVTPSGPAFQASHQLSHPPSSSAPLPASLGMTRDTQASAQPAGPLQQQQQQLFMGQYQQQHLQQQQQLAAFSSLLPQMPAQVAPSQQQQFQAQLQQQQQLAAAAAHFAALQSNLARGGWAGGHQAAPSSHLPPGPSGYPNMYPTQFGYPPAMPPAALNPHPFNQGPAAQDNLASYYAAVGQEQLMAEVAAALGRQQQQQPGAVNPLLLTQYLQLMQSNQTTQLHQQHYHQSQHLQHQLAAQQHMQHQAQHHMQQQMAAAAAAAMPVPPVGRSSIPPPALGWQQQQQQGTSFGLPTGRPSGLLEPNGALPQMVDGGIGNARIAGDVLQYNAALPLLPPQSALDSMHQSGGVDGMDLDASTSQRRAAALVKYRNKRKNLCFSKTIRYESRKQLAQQRPRVKGQFVKHVKAGDGEDGTLDAAEGGGDAEARQARGSKRRAQDALDDDDLDDEEEDDWDVEDDEEVSKGAPLDQGGAARGATHGAGRAKEAARLRALRCDEEEADVASSLMGLRDASRVGPSAGTLHPTAAPPAPHTAQPLPFRPTPLPNQPHTSHPHHTHHQHPHHPAPPHPDLSIKATEALTTMLRNASAVHGGSLARGSGGTALPSSGGGGGRHTAMGLQSLQQSHQLSHQQQQKPGDTGAKNGSDSGSNSPNEDGGGGS